MRRESIPLGHVEAHEIALRRARKYLSLVLRVPPNRIQQILTTPHGAELVLSAVATVRKMLAEFRDADMQDQYTDNAQVALLAREIRWEEAIVVWTPEPMGAAQEVSKAPPAPPDQGAVLRWKKWSRRHNSYLKKEELWNISAAFKAFFLLSDIQVLYRQKPKLPWQIRMERVITAWNLKHPESAIHHYYWDWSYRDTYDIHGGEDFQRLFGFHPTKYTLPVDTPPWGEDGESKKWGEVLTQVPYREEKTLWRGTWAQPNTGGLREGASVPLSNIEKRDKALEIMKDGIAKIKTQIAAYNRGNSWLGALSNAALSGELENFEVDAFGKYHITFKLSVEDIENQKKLSSLFESNVFAHHMSANGWNHDRVNNTWIPPGEHCEFRIHIPYVPRTDELPKEVKGNAEDITTVISSMRGTVIGCINSYILSLGEKRLEKWHDVGSAHRIPLYPEGYLITQMKGKKINCSTGSRHLPETLFSALQDRKKLSEFLERHHSIYPGLTIHVLKNATVFVLERDGYSLVLPTQIEAE